MTEGTYKTLRFCKTYANDLVNALVDTPIFFAVCVAQACAESGYATSYSAINKNNFFGIMQGSKTKKFDTPTDCFTFYVNNLINYPSYIKTGVANATTPYLQLRAIADGGYYSANNDDNLDKTERPPYKIWTLQESADRYYKYVKSFIDKVLLNLPIGKITSDNYMDAQQALTNIDIPKKYNS
jgi:hypothetical protein